MNPRTWFGIEENASARAPTRAAGHDTDWGRRHKDWCKRSTKPE